MVPMSIVPERVRWPAAALRCRLRGHFRPLAPAYTDPLRDARVLEVGGPSAIFGADGLLPVYPIARSVDNTQFAATDTWHLFDEQSDAFAPDGRQTGRQLFIDDLTLSPIGDDAYDAVMSSHVIEHIANPLLAFAAWARIVRPGGHLLMVTPHYQGTFDRRRPVTPLAHMVEDHERGVSENDGTHIQEAIDLHDFARDAGHRTDAWIADRRDNASTRVVHHHVFGTRSLLELVDRAGLRILEHETRFPHDIYVLAQFPLDGEAPDNAEVLRRVDTGPFDR
jgi:SAM-dependent methyltransferase